MIWGSVSELVLHVMLALSPTLALSICSSIRRTILLPHGQGGDEQLLVLLLLGIAGQVVEEVETVLDELRVVGEVREIRVDAGCPRIVVACARWT